jgi:nucleoside 2-deoxyribosyltransferase
MKIYIASPLGFSEAGRSFYGQELLPSLGKLGHELLDPWTLTSSGKISKVNKMPYGARRREAWQKLNIEIGRNNALALQSADMVFAVLDGVDVDSGTASEIGFAAALLKPIVGYRGDFRLSADNDGATVNLQVEYFIRANGGTIVQTIKDIPGAIKSCVVRLSKGKHNET